MFPSLETRDYLTSVIHFLRLLTFLAWLLAPVTHTSNLMFLKINFCLEALEPFIAGIWTLDKPLKNTNVSWDHFSTEQNPWEAIGSNSTGQNITHHFWNPPVHYGTHNRPKWTLILNRPNPVYTLIPYFFNISFITIHLSELWRLFSMENNMTITLIKFTFIYSTSN